MAQVMIVDNVAPEAAQVLQQEGHQVKTVAGRLNTAELIAACTGCQGLIYARSRKLQPSFWRPSRAGCGGRAGIGVDNIDIEQLRSAVC